MDEPMFYYDCIIRGEEVCVRVDSREYYEKTQGAVCRYTGRCDRLVMDALVRRAVENNAGGTHDM